MSEQTANLCTTDAAESLRAVVAERDREIERLNSDYNEACEDAMCVARELERLNYRYQREVYGLNNEGDPIGGDPAGGYANDNARLRKELSALKAQHEQDAQTIKVLQAMARQLKADLGAKNGK